MNDMNIDHYGFKTQTENILLHDISQIDRTRDQAAPGRDDFLYHDIGFDLELNTQRLICRNLIEEAHDLIKQMQEVIK